MAKKLPRGIFARNGVYWGRARINMRERRWTLGTRDIEIAKQRYQATREKIVARYVFGDDRLRLQEVIAEWELSLKGQISESTRTRYLCSIGRLKGYLEGRFLDEIDGLLIAQIISSRRRSGLTNATIKRDLVALSSVMNFAIDQGWCENNTVLSRMRRLKERRDPIQLPDVQDIQLVIEKAPGLFAKLIEAAWKTGARQEEIANARRRQFDSARKQLTVIGKGNKLRVIDLTPFNAQGLFESLPIVPGDPPLFWSGRGRRFANVSSRFSALAKRLAKADPSFRPFRFHDLRHRHAVDWLKAGYSIYDLQKRLGHANIKTTEIYLAFLTPDEARRSMYGETNVLSEIAARG